MHWPTIFTTRHPTVGVASLWLVLNTLAVFRLSWVVARDSITAGARNRIETKYQGSFISLINCIWCLSFWFAIVGFVLTYFDSTRPWWLAIATILTMSAIAGLLSEWGG